MQFHFEDVILPKITLNRLINLIKKLFFSKQPEKTFYWTSLQHRTLLTIPEKALCIICTSKLWQQSGGAIANSDCCSCDTFQFCCFKLKISQKRNCKSPEQEIEEAKFSHNLTWKLSAKESLCRITSVPRSTVLMHHIKHRRRQYCIYENVSKLHACVLTSHLFKYLSGVLVYRHQA